MGTRDPRIDAYIERSADFAKPILRHLREIVHEACPDVEETIKWGAPYFAYEGLLGGMAAFKEHCAFGFWKGALVVDDQGKSAEAAGHLGRITKISDLPPKKVLVGYMKKAVALNESGEKVARKPKRVKELPVPEYLTAALKKNRKALATFEGFTPSHRREYVEWITEAKREDTRQRRLEQAIEWMAEGKPRHWKHMRS
jgi:uncharacterized protein YdeI (YjbR/CyaY-like superfamily)